MTLDDIASWHRAQLRAHSETAHSAWAGYFAGNEDRVFEARGWEKLAAKHGEMAAAIESHAAVTPC